MNIQTETLSDKIAAYQKLLTEAKSVQNDYGYHYVEYQRLARLHLELSNRAKETKKSIDAMIISGCTLV